MSALDTFLAAGASRPLDHHLALILGRLAGESDEAALLGVLAASLAVGRGHVCAELGRLANTAVTNERGEVLPGLSWPSLTAWRGALSRSALTSDGPLVLDGADRLYLRRYFLYEQRLASQLRERITAPPLGDPRPLQAAVERLFAGMGPEADGQRRATERICQQRFSVLAGGPGTGKTTTVVRILALLIEQSQQASRPDPRILLLAPTGKAAQRLKESIRKAKGGLPVSDRVRDAIPEEASTLHRALGPIEGSPTQFRRNAKAPLAADVVLIDECSMVDLATLVRTLDAVPPEAQLILLGDPDQLASVEAGAILGDLCRAPALRGSLSTLSHSYRFSGGGQIGQLAKAIRSGEADEALALLRGGREVRLSGPSPGHSLGAALESAVTDGYTPVLRARSAADRLRALDTFRVLCAHRQGADGVVGITPNIERALARQGLLRPERRHYPLRPVIITVNDYDLQLYNGDVGITGPETRGAARVAFPGLGDGPPRELAASRLPSHETVFAMSVHKSQGSEFDAVALVLPERPSPILTRELLYTGLTRARLRCGFWGGEEALRRAIATPIQRASGLVEALR